MACKIFLVALLSVLCGTHGLPAYKQVPAFFEPLYKTSYQPTYQKTYDPTYKKTYEPTFQKTYEPTYQKAYEPAYLPAPEYDFEYGVDDPTYDGPSFGASEARDGYLTKGSYFVDLPDGRRQRVSYYVSEDSGFVADVSYEQIYEKPKYVVKTIEPYYPKAAYVKPVVEKRVTFIPEATYQEIPAPPPQLVPASSFSHAAPGHEDQDSDEQDNRREDSERDDDGDDDINYGEDRKRSVYVTSYTPGGGSYSYFSVPGSFDTSPYKRAVEDPFNIEAAGYL